MRSLLPKLVILVILAVLVIAIGIALPLVRHLYEQPTFFWVSLVGAVVVGGILVVAPVKATTSTRRKLIIFGAAAILTAIQVFRIYTDFKSPPLWPANPQLLGVFRELVHILEYGFLAFMASRLLKSEMGGAVLHLAALLYAVIVGIADESFQWHHAFRVGDLRDVQLNAVSASIGLLYQAGLARTPPAGITRSARGVVLLLALSAPFLYTDFYLRTQTGHLICDDNTNCFTSHFSQAQLEENARDRALRWRDVPTGSLAEENRKASFWTSEDHFLTEARAHFRLGNNAAAAGDWVTACGEIQVLVDQYSPAIPAMGVRPQDYRCEDGARDFRSRAFPRLDTEVQPDRQWTLASIMAIALVGLVLLLTRKMPPRV